MIKKVGLFCQLRTDEMQKKKKKKKKKKKVYFIGYVLKKPVPDENDKTIESDSKQKNDDDVMMKLDRI